MTSGRATNLRQANERIEKLRVALEDVIVNPESWSDRIAQAALRADDDAQTAEAADGIERDLRDLHEALGIYTQSEPAWPSEDVIDLRLRLLDEEVEELKAAVRNREPLANVAKEACDVETVVVGLAVAFGIPYEECWRRVLASNMAKAGGPVREDGKVLKPPGWQPPDLSGLFPAEDPS